MTEEEVQRYIKEFWLSCQKADRKVQGKLAKLLCLQAHHLIFAVMTRLQERVISTCSGKPEHLQCGSPQQSWAPEDYTDLHHPSNFDEQRCCKFQLGFADAGNSQQYVGNEAAYMSETDLRRLLRMHADLKLIIM